MALRAVVGKPGVAARNPSRIKKCFATARLKENDAGDSANNGEEADPKARSPKRMFFLVIAEIAFVAFGNLLLRSARCGHAWRSVIKKRHKRMPPCEYEQQKRKRHVNEQPAVQPMVQFCLKIEHATLVAP